MEEVVAFAPKPRRHTCFTNRLSKMMLLAAIFASLSGVIGLYLSYYISIASGAAIVLAATFFFVAAFGWKKAKQP